MEPETSQNHDSLFRNQQRLAELVEDTREELQYQRARREVWEQWSRVIDVVREKDRQIFINLILSEAADGLDVELADRMKQFLNIVDNLPRNFSELQQHLPHFMQNREFLSYCQQKIGELEL